MPFTSAYVAQHYAQSDSSATSSSNDSDAPSTNPPYPEAYEFQYAHEGAHPVTNWGNTRSETLGSDYSALYGTPMRHGDASSAASQMQGDVASQQPQNMGPRNYFDDATSWPNGVQSHLFPTLHSQELNNELYADEASTYGSQGVQGPSSPEDEDDIQEGSREAWLAAINANTEWTPLPRAMSMTPPIQQNAAQRFRSPTPGPRRMLPVFEPRVRIHIPVSVSGASLVPPPNQTLEATFQEQKAWLVEGRD
ncbi:hypothetical protein HDV63DRAFT_386655 [Trichoderma sp. SZMC 28014]